MNKTVLVVLLAAAAGCGSKKSGPDCEAAITRGIESSIKVLKERVPDPQVVEANLGIMNKVKGVLIEPVPRQARHVVHQRVTPSFTSVRSTLPPSAAKR